MPSSKPKKGFLFDVRVVELADVKGEFCGRLLAGAGADVIKVEPPGGNPTRGIGPFYHDEPDPERSLYFWHYNHGKRSVTLDINQTQDREALKRLAGTADVLIETFPPGHLESLGLGYDELSRVNPKLIVSSITPFGQSGPWRDWKASDLVHLALGGIMMNCGYDPTPEGEYDTPPIAPQMWHSSHIAGNLTYIAIVGALLSRERTGKGQHLDSPIHQAVSTNTEIDVPTWVYNRVPVHRQTGRHAGTRPTTMSQSTTKDGRFVLCSGGLGRSTDRLLDLLRDLGAAMDTVEPQYRDAKFSSQPHVAHHIDSLSKKLVSSYKFDRDLWKEGQKQELHWAPIRTPEENLADPHWAERETFTDVYHEDIDRSLTYVRSPWLSETCPFRAGPRAPHAGEHTEEVLGSLEASGPRA